MFLKSIAVITSTLFIATNLSWANISNEPLRSDAAVHAPINSIQIPEVLGTVQDQHVSAPGSPFVVLIQDAHAVTDAQIQIQKLIQYLGEKYGISLAALEGTSGKMDATLLRAFPDGKAKERVLSDYLSRGEITGAEMAAVFNAHPTEFFGIEDMKLYEENYFAYLSAVKNQKSIFTSLEKSKSELDNRRKTVYSAKHIEFHLQVESFRTQKTAILELFKYFRGFDLKKYSNLKKICDLSDQEITKKNIHQISDIKGTELFGEMENFISETENSFCSNQEQKDILASYRQNTLLHDLASLELTKEQWGEFLTHPPASQWAPLTRGDFSLSVPSNPPRRIRPTAEKRGRHEVRGVSDPAFQAAVNFYQLALRRDDALHQNLSQLLAKQKAKSAIVIAGGFHAQGFKEALKKSGYSYAVVLPTLRSANGHENYAGLMQGNLSYKQYLKTSLYDAFLKDASIKLARALDRRDSAQKMKYWRDEVIRTAARQGRAGDSGKYTRYIDSLNAKSREEILASVRKVLDSFLAENIQKIGNTLPVSAKASALIQPQAHPLMTESGRFLDFAPAGQSSGNSLGMPAEIQKIIAEIQDVNPVTFEQKTTKLPWDKGQKQSLRHGINPQLVASGLVLDKIGSRLNGRDDEWWRRNHQQGNLRTQQGAEEMVRSKRSGLANHYRRYFVGVGPEGGDFSWYVIHQILHDIFLSSLDPKLREEFLDLVIAQREFLIKRNEERKLRAEYADYFEPDIHKYDRSFGLNREFSKDSLTNADGLVNLSEVFTRLGQEYLGYLYKRDNPRTVELSAFHPFFDKIKLRASEEDLKALLTSLKATGRSLGEGDRPGSGTHKVGPDLLRGPPEKEPTLGTIIRDVIDLDKLVYGLTVDALRQSGTMEDLEKRLEHEKTIFKKIEKTTTDDGKSLPVIMEQSQTSMFDHRQVNIGMISVPISGASVIGKEFGLDESKESHQPGESEAFEDVLKRNVAEALVRAAHPGANFEDPDRPQNAYLGGRIVIPNVDSAWLSTNLNGVIKNVKDELKKKYEEKIVENIEINPDNKDLSLMDRSKKVMDALMDFNKKVDGLDFHASHVLVHLKPEGEVKVKSFSIKDVEERLNEIKQEKFKGRTSFDPSTMKTVKERNELFTLIDEFQAEQRLHYSSAARYWMDHENEPDSRANASHFLELLLEDAIKKLNERLEFIEKITNDGLKRVVQAEMKRKKARMDVLDNESVRKIKETLVKDDEGGLRAQLFQDFYIGRQKTIPLFNRYTGRLPRLLSRLHDVYNEEDPEESLLPSLDKAFEELKKDFNNSNPGVLESRLEIFRKNYKAYRKGGEKVTPRHGKRNLRGFNEILFAAYSDSRLQRIYKLFWMDEVLEADSKGLLEEWKNHLESHRQRNLARFIEPGLFLFKRPVGDEVGFLVKDTDGNYHAAFAELNKGNAYFTKHIPDGRDRVYHKILMKYLRAAIVFKKSGKAKDHPLGALGFLERLDDLIRKAAPESFPDIEKVKLQDKPLERMHIYEIDGMRYAKARDGKVYVQAFKPGPWLPTDEIIPEGLEPVKATLSAARTVRSEPVIPGRDKIKAVFAELDYDNYEQKKDPKLIHQVATTDQIRNKPASTRRFKLPKKKAEGSSLGAADVELAKKMLKASKALIIKNISSSDLERFSADKEKMDPSVAKAIADILNKNSLDDPAKAGSNLRSLIAFMRNKEKKAASAPAPAAVVKTEPAAASPVPEVLAPAVVDVPAAIVPEVKKIEPERKENIAPAVKEAPAEEKPLSQEIAKPGEAHNKEAELFETGIVWELSDIVRDLGRLLNGEDVPTPLNILEQRREDAVRKIDDAKTGALASLAPETAAEILSRITQIRTVLDDLIQKVKTQKFEEAEANDPERISSFMLSGDQSVVIRIGKGPKTPLFLVSRSGVVPVRRNEKGELEFSGQYISFDSTMTDPKQIEIGTNKNKIIYMGANHFFKIYGFYMGGEEEQHVHLIKDWKQGEEKTVIHDGKLENGKRAHSSSRGVYVEASRITPNENLKFIKVLLRNGDILTALKHYEIMTPETLAQADEGLLESVLSDFVQYVVDNDYKLNSDIKERVAILNLKMIQKWIDRAVEKERGQEKLSVQFSLDGTLTPQGKADPKSMNDKMKAIFYYKQLEFVYQEMAQSKNRVFRTEVLNQILGFVDESISRKLARFSTFVTAGNMDLAGQQIDNALSLYYNFEGFQYHKAGIFQEILSSFAWAVPQLQEGNRRKNVVALVARGAIDLLDYKQGAEADSLVDRVKIHLDPYSEVAAELARKFPERFQVDFTATDEKIDETVIGKIGSGEIATAVLHEEELDEIQKKIALPEPESIRGLLSELLWTHNTSPELFELILKSDTIKADPPKNGGGKSMRGAQFRYGLDSEYGAIKVVMKRGFEFKEKYRNKGRDHYRETSKVFYDFFKKGKEFYGREMSEEELRKQLAADYDFRRHLSPISREFYLDSRPYFARSYFNPQLQFGVDIDFQENIEAVLIPEHLYDRVVQLVRDNRIKNGEELIQTKFRKIAGTGRDDKEYYAYQRNNGTEIGDVREAVLAGVRRPGVFGNSSSAATSKKAFELEEKAYAGIVSRAAAKEEAPQLKLPSVDQVSESEYSAISSGIFQHHGLEIYPSSYWKYFGKGKAPGLRHENPRKLWKLFINPDKDHFLEVLDRVSKVLESETDVLGKIIASNETRRVSGVPVVQDPNEPKMLLYFYGDNAKEDLARVTRSLEHEFSKPGEIKKISADEGKREHFGKVVKQWGPSFTKMRNPLLFYTQGGYTESGRSSAIAVASTLEAAQRKLGERFDGDNFYRYKGERDPFDTADGLSLGAEEPNLLDRISNKFFLKLIEKYAAYENLAPQHGWNQVAEELRASRKGKGDRGVNLEANREWAIYFYQNTEERVRNYIKKPGVWIIFEFEKPFARIRNFSTPKIGGLYHFRLQEASPLVWREVDFSKNPPSSIYVKGDEADVVRIRKQFDESGFQIPVISSDALSVKPGALYHATPEIAKRSSIVDEISNYGALLSQKDLLSHEFLFKAIAHEVYGMPYAEPRTWTKDQWRELRNTSRVILTRVRTAASSLGAKVDGIYEDIKNTEDIAAYVTSEDFERYVTNQFGDSGGLLVSKIRTAVTGPEIITLPVQLSEGAKFLLANPKILADVLKSKNGIDLHLESDYVIDASFLHSYDAMKFIQKLGQSVAVTFASGTPDADLASSLRGTKRVGYGHNNILDQKKIRGVENPLLILPAGISFKFSAKSDWKKRGVEAEPALVNPYETSEFVRLVEIILQTRKLKDNGVSFPVIDQEMLNSVVTLLNNLAKEELTREALGRAA